MMLSQVLTKERILSNDKEKEMPSTNAKKRLSEDKNEPSNDIYIYV